MKNSLLVFILLAVSCNSTDPDLKGVNFREEMRTFVGEISIYAKEHDPDFIIIPQNGVELTIENGDADGQPALLYINNIDAVGQEDLFYGYDVDNVKSPATESDYLVSFLNIVRDNGKAVLVTDYCSDASKMDDSYLLNKNQGYISFAAPSRELKEIPVYPPSPRDSNDRDILTINDANNFLYLINPEEFTSKQAFIDAVGATNYDVIIMDAFLNNEIWLPHELKLLKTKFNGGKRLVICYMSIGEAEDYRYYWQPEWSSTPPEWLSGANPDWPGNYKVKYWMSSWKKIIYGNNEAYLDKLLASGFDGTYLDIIDGFEYFEDLK